ncbi:Protein of unknown function [Cotesia congregata]|uniref:Uncharacterized protein n=1 Tax=Cotesia congregata TaxID=51543 RepID=A0A8J2H8F2_COTCN|nr:Protein of unknown function [Cotesia congregata]
MSTSELINYKTIHDLIVKDIINKGKNAVENKDEKNGITVRFSSIRRDEYHQVVTKTNNTKIVRVTGPKRRRVGKTVIRKKVFVKVFSLFKFEVKHINTHLNYYESPDPSNKKKKKKKNDNNKLKQYSELLRRYLFFKNKSHEGNSTVEKIENNEVIPDTADFYAINRDPEISNISINNSIAEQNKSIKKLPINTSTPKRHMRSNDSSGNSQNFLSLTNNTLQNGGNKKQLYKNSFKWLRL